MDELIKAAIRDWLDKDGGKFLVKSDPVECAENLFEIMRMITVVVPPRHPRAEAAMVAGIAEVLKAYRTAVQEDLLATQRETNDALAAALNMRGKS